MTDDELLRQFEAATLPEELWTHRAHVRVAYRLLSELAFDAAVDRMREDIKRYAAARGVEESPTSGYNETTTVAFLWLVAATMHAYGDAFLASDGDAFCDAHPQLLSKHVLRLFYSPERRMHPDAKTTFVEPDLAPLPKFSRE